jgi:hypothetical protein
MKFVFGKTNNWVIVKQELEIKHSSKNKTKKSCKIRELKRKNQIGEQNNEGSHVMCFNIIQ